MQVTRRFVATLIVALSAVTAAHGDEAVSQVETFGDWTLLADSESPHLFCFVTSEARASSPKDSHRETPRAYISAWPKDGIRAEVSFRVGYRFEKGAEGNVAVGSANFEIFGTDHRAFVSEPTQELKLIEAMRKGNTMTVASSSDDGSHITDTYSLYGLGLALQRLQTLCF
ncbi:hypothetical protein DLM45_07785 [Hyphomicrobium methylovorum]|uniref:hypothetical protein n=1 Tax=Hyphomicrobium methylovorum TaxID=84 RepID=UPI0015E65D5E|nr:hypothetical protein [Hyphomicrobium methylovorum]MBA2126122.1 hypothetical protein [Hyphomicrobium methylovorum]